MPAMAKPAEFIDGISVDGDVWKVQRGPDNTLVMQYDQYSGKKCVIFDVVSGSIKRTVPIQDMNEEFIGMFSDGTVITIRYTDNALLFYAPGSTAPESHKPGVEYVPEYRVNVKDNCVYWSDPQLCKIYKMDKSGSVSIVHESTDMYSVMDINPDEGYFHANAFTEETENGMEECMFSLDTGKCIAALGDNVYGAFFTDDTCSGITTDYENTTQSGSPRSKLEVHKLSDGSVKCYDVSHYDSNEMFNMFGSRECRYALMSSYTPGMYENISALYCLDTENGTYGRIDADTSNATWIKPCYFPELGRWIAVVNYINGGVTRQRIVMIDPEMVKYDQKFETAALTEKYVPQTCGAAYKDVRKKADAVEEKYGVTILIGDEVKNSERSSNYIFTSTEAPECCFTAEDIAEAVDSIDLLLSVYPSGFFKHFQANGKCGLRISVVYDLKTESYSSFVSGGIAYTTGGWFEIVLPVSTYTYGKSSFHHELTHCVDMLISRRYGLDEGKWKELDPQGFDYTSDFDGYAENSNNGEDSYEYFLDADNIAYDKPYFASSYGKVTPLEDRATLIEKVLTTRYSYKTDKYTLIGTEDLNKYPHLKAKLDYFGELTKQEFGYVFWEKVEENIKANEKYMEY